MTPGVNQAFKFLITVNLLDFDKNFRIFFIKLIIGLNFVSHFSHSVSFKLTFF